MNDASHQVRAERVAGTAISVHVRSSRDAACAFEDLTALLRAIDRRLSARRLATRQGRHHQRASDPASELTAAVEQWQILREGAGDAFDAPILGSPDPSAWILGCAVDQAGALLTEHGFEDWMIDVSGDVLVNAPDNAEAWQIRVPHPLEPAAVTVLHARHLAVATSDAKRSGHDSRRTPEAAAPKSTTVCGPSLATARTLSAAALALGSDGPAMVAGHPGYECWTAFSDRHVATTLGFPRAVERPLLTVTPGMTALRRAA